MRGYGGEIANLPVEIKVDPPRRSPSFSRTGPRIWASPEKACCGRQSRTAMKDSTFSMPCGFGQRHVVGVVVPARRIDVRQMSDLEDTAMSYWWLHGRRLRVATKAMNLDAALLLSTRRQRLPDRTEPGRNRRRASGAFRRADRRYHHDGRCAPTSQTLSDGIILRSTGAARIIQGCLVVCVWRWKSSRSSSPP